MFEGLAKMKQQLVVLFLFNFYFVTCQKRA